MAYKKRYKNYRKKVGGWSKYKKKGWGKRKSWGKKKKVRRAIRRV